MLLDSEILLKSRYFQIYHLLLVLLGLRSSAFLLGIVSCFIEFFCLVHVCVFFFFFCLAFLFTSRQERKMSCEVMKGQVFFSQDSCLSPACFWVYLPGLLRQCLEVCE